MSREKSEAFSQYNILKSKMQVMVDEKVKEIMDNMKNNDKNSNKGICLQARVNMNSNKELREDPEIMAKENSKFDKKF